MFCKLLFAPYISVYISSNAILTERFTWSLVSDYVTFFPRAVMLLKCFIEKVDRNFGWSVKKNYLFN